MDPVDAVEGLGAQPVQFEVGYTQAGKPATAQLDELPDLGQVSYSGRPTAA